MAPLCLVALTTVCSDGPGPEVIPGPTAVLRVEYAAGGDAQLSGTAPTVTRAPVELSPGQTTWCVTFAVQGSTPSGPLDPERPQVSNPSVSMCADGLENFPVEFDAVIDGTVENRATSHATANTVSYDAGSGAVHMEPLVGGFARIEVDAWYRPRGSSSPFVFRIVGHLIGRE